MKALVIIIALFCQTVYVTAQDIPLFSQKLTTSFMYNPALAGLSTGSVTFSHRSNYSGVKGAPVNNFISLQAPLANYRFGAGLNLYSEDVSFIKTNYTSAAFAYHLHLNKLTALSFGVSAEYNTLKLNTADIVGNFSSDLVLQQLQQGTNNSADFSFGTLYSNQFIKAGFALNRLSTAWIKPDSIKLLASYYSGFVQGSIPMRDGQDLLEPYIAFRKFSETNNTYDIGLYYTYNNMITAGMATRRGSVFSATLAYRFKNFMIGYSREMIAGGVGGFVGSSNEFALRFDFMSQGYTVALKEDYKSSLAYRRKTLTSGSVNKPGGHTPKQLSKSQKKAAAYSPNSRYQNTSKLSQGKKTSMKKPSYSSKKARPGSKSKKSNYSKKYKRRR